jgi:magnesium chelatase subunit D
VKIRSDDFRIRRFAERSEATLVFVVDASGSAAAERLAETKGAVELLLAEAYVKRTQVALVAFRGSAAELLLAPTRSLVRAKKCLADLVGGGGTPLAAGLEAGQLVADAARERGRTPFMVVMTDGRANVARDGSGDRSKAGEDARQAAARIGASGMRGVVIDIAARPRDDARAIAAAMKADYAALPTVNAAATRRIVTALAP